MVDLLTSAVAFEFRASEGLAKNTSTKGQLASDVRSAYGIDSFLGGCEASRVNVKMYQETINRAAARPLGRGLRSHANAPGLQLLLLTR